MNQPAQEPEDRATTLIGTVVNDRYRIVRVLGEGGMGTVFEAEHELVGKRVALKMLLPELASDAGILERFRREARAASTIGHEHIVDVLDMGALPNGAPFIAMELLNGQELAELLRDAGPLPAGRAVRIMLDVCSALSAAHAAGIVHRDLKPANIFLVERGDGLDFPKVLDFGISKIQGKGVNDQGLTKTGIAMGTPAYMSPEQAQGLKTVDQRTDVYAIGTILFEMLTGRTPFRADTYATLLIKVLMQPPPPLSDFRKDLPPELTAIVQRTLEKEPERRFESMDELAEALKPFAELDAPVDMIPAEQQPSEPSVPRGPQTHILEAREAARADVSLPPAPPKRSLAPLVIGVVVAMLALGGLGAFLALSGSSETSEGETARADTHPGETSDTGSDPSGPAADESATPPEPSGTETSANAIPEGEDVPPEVRIQIRVVPPDAEIYIGDVRFPNPMDAQQTRALTPTTIRIERSGYRTVERLVIFDRDRSLDIEMSRGGGVDRSGSARPRGGHTQQGHQQQNQGSTDQAQQGGTQSGGIYRGDQRGLRDDF